MKTPLTFLLVLFSLFVRGDYWTRKADFPGNIYQTPMGFSIGTKGYGLVSIGTGAPLYEYNPINDTWVAKANFPARLAGCRGLVPHGAAACQVLPRIGERSQSPDLSIDG